MRVLGIDYGQRRIGLALSDPLGIVAGGLPTVTVGSDDEAFAAVAKVVEERGVREIVVGLPRNMNGSIGPQAEKVGAFAERLRALGKPVHLMDERLTSARANRVMLDHGFSRKKRGKHVDRMAAQFILQTWLNARKTSKDDGPSGGADNTIP